MIYLISNAAHLKIFIDWRVWIIIIWFSITYPDFFAISVYRYFLFLEDVISFLILLYLFKETFDIFIVISCKFTNTLKGSTQITFNFLILLSSINNKIIDPIFKVNIDSMHVFAQFTQTSF